MRMKGRVFCVSLRFLVGSRFNSKKFSVTFLPFMILLYSTSPPFLLPFSRDCIFHTHSRRIEETWNFIDRSIVDFVFALRFLSINIEKKKRKNRRYKFNSIEKVFETISWNPTKEIYYFSIFQRRKFDEKKWRFRNIRPSRLVQSDEPLSCNVPRPPHLF